MAATRRQRCAAACRPRRQPFVAQLVQQDRECCHSILFHAQLLRPAVQMLVAGGRYGAAQQLLAAARAYAGSLGAPPRPAPRPSASHSSAGSEAAIVECVAE